ncbi:hypothetical protein DMB92_00900 [Campylobacter sp. MIT 99-7217]|uniref:outer membrane beta-barrel protein n=1 Tax=Campylobacter sp. MIT 99-7217 TaxID=535091 RepID=UPI0011590AF8|nr:outer membrane beta-barrel protein [Campylobacter sp. MIT 99-7217]TQR34555.1 hypothetical protein DMB92_00900 [Campylobacter sp. MIT 99-7217]
MKKILVAIFAVLSLCPFVHAEKSAIFVGGQVNIGMVTREAEGEYTNGGIFVYKGTGSSMGSSVGLGVLLGYKHFFTDTLGLRAYAEANGNTSVVENGWGDREYAPYTKFGANIDVLWNYKDKSKSSQGIFAGLNYTNYSYSDTFTDVFPANKDKSGGSMGLNLGWRMKEQNSNLEVGAKIPFSNEIVMGETNTYKVSVKENFSILVRYIYDFEF